MAEFLGAHIDVASASVFDVGCNSGEFLLTCQANGFQIGGCEVSPDRAGAASRILGREIVPLPFEDMGVRAPVDILTFWDVFEHFTDPNAALRVARTLLRNGGFLAMEVPNADGLYHKILGRRWWFGFEHIYYYTVAGLRALLANNGFEVVHAETDNINLLTREGLARLRLFGDDGVWGRGVASEDRRHMFRRWRGSLASGKGMLRERANSRINALLNERMLGDQLRIVARYGRTYEAQARSA